MCGICGVYYRDPERPVEPTVLEAMSHALRARGPDDHVLEAGRGFGFAVRRLAVIDPRPEARPPYRAGALTVLFNGEIYGHRAWRERLLQRGIALRSRTDGELLPHLLAPGAEGAELAELEGMYAVACYDAERHALWLARDPAGEKPLVFASIPGGVAFASTPAALLAHPEVDGTLDEASLVDHLRYGFLPDEHGAHRALRRVAPGGRWVFDRDGAHERPPLERTVPARDTLERSLERAVADRLVADRPVGLFLSGGIDSGLIASCVGGFSDDGAPVRAFTARFPEDADESAAAAATAKACGVPLTVVDLEPEVFEHLEPLTRAAGEPLGDASILTLHALARAAREHVVVALTGDGADEWFHGYDRYRWLATFGGFARRVHARVDPLEGGSAGTRWRRALGTLLAGEAAYPALLQRFSQRTLAGLWRDPDVLAEQGERDARRLGEWLAARRVLGPGLAAAQWDRRHYLPYDPLWKSDLAGMAAALELRAPFLDARVRAHAPTRAPHLLRRGKPALRELARRRGLPAAVVRARKRGFRTPLERFYAARGGASAVLAPHLDALASRVHVDRVRALARDHDTGRASHAARLYHLLALGVFLASRERPGTDVPPRATRARSTPP